MPAATRAAIITLGCGRNEVDSDQLAGLLHREGIEVVDEPDGADVVLVNTCTFIAPAKQESIDTVLAACDLKQDGGARAVVVVGCLAQRYPHELADAVPEADAVVGFDGYPILPQVLDEVLTGRLVNRVVGVGPAHPGRVAVDRALPLLSAPPAVQTAAPGADPAVVSAPPAGTVAPPGALPADTVRATRVEGGLLDLPLVEQHGPRPAASDQDGLDRVPASGPRFPVRAHDGRPWAYLKIASGCDRLCTFCAIPSFRGRFRSRPLDELLAEATWLAGRGVRELVLVSENTTSWGKDLPGGRGLQPALLHELAAVEGIERLRLMYLQPAEITAPLLEAMAEVPAVVPYLDLSLQHVSAPVLSRMARSGDPERFAAMIARIRTLLPDAVFRSSFILGFPGETERDVDVLEEFLLSQRLDWVGLFTFSQEDGTPSATMPEQVPAALAAERRDRIAGVQELVADELARCFVGRHLDVLVEEVDDDGVVRTLGRSYREAPDTDGEVELVRTDGQPAEVPVGGLVEARVVDAVGVDLRAELVASADGGTCG